MKDIKMKLNKTEQQIIDFAKTAQYKDMPKNIYWVSKHQGVRKDKAVIKLLHKGLATIYERNPNEFHTMIIQITTN